MRLCLFTDTLGDINGVSRFIRTIAEQAAMLGRELHVVTSTRFACPTRSNIHNVPPRHARAMPGYPQLEIVWPRGRDIRLLARSLRPDIVHVSTPGPIGLIGRRFAIHHALPLVGTYHTDFPAYIDHLFADRVCTWLASAAMKRFYRPFNTIFTRSDEYAQHMQTLGIDPACIARLLPGIDTDTFHVRHRDPSIWSRMPGVPPFPSDSIKAIYVGRVSVEKNLPLLTSAWKLAAAANPALHLIVIGDGPYRAAMQAGLAGLRASFLGFRHGSELSALYASADMFLFPSTTDTLGQVVMEAQSSGLPVLITNQGGPISVVNHTSGPDQSGIVLSAHDPAEWASEIVRLASDPSRRARLGAAGHAKICFMSIRHSFEHFWHVHEQVLIERLRKLQHNNLKLGGAGEQP